MRSVTCSYVNRCCHWRSDAPSILQAKNATRSLSVQTAIFGIANISVFLTLPLGLQIGYRMRETLQSITVYVHKQSLTGRGFFLVFALSNNALTAAQSFSSLLSELDCPPLSVPSGVLILLWWQGDSLVFCVLWCGSSVPLSINTTT